MSEGEPCSRGDLACQLGREQAKESYEARQKKKEKKETHTSCVSDNGIFSSHTACNWLKVIPAHSVSTPGSVVTNDMYSLLDGLGLQNWKVSKLTDFAFDVITLGKNPSPFGPSDLLNDPYGTEKFSKGVERQVIDFELEHHGTLTTSYTYTNDKSYIKVGISNSPSISSSSRGGISICGSTSGICLSTTLQDTDADAAADWFITNFGER